nr:hypothetical protein [Tanacetum cinerariifolium]
MTFLFDFSRLTESFMPLLTTLMETCATLSQKVAELEKDKHSQSLEILQLKKRVKRLARKKMSNTLGLKRLRRVGAAQRVDSSADTILVAMDVESQGRLNLEDVNTASKGVSAVSATELVSAVKPIVFDEEDNNEVMMYQALKRKPLTKAQERKNMMIYLKNMAGFKMNFFKGMTYSEIRPLFEKHYNSIQAFLEKEEEEVTVQENKTKEEGIKRQEATPLALKVPVVDYQIHYENNKPFYKIIRADGTYKEDLEALWSLVKERFSATKPKNFSDDFLLVTLGAMFEKPNIHAQIWKNQRSVHGPEKVKCWKLLESCVVQIITFTTTQLILLVERKYPLTRFTIDQMLNIVRLEVEEESEVSLELLRTNLYIQDLTVCDNMESVSTHMVAAAKLPVLNPNEFELWKIRIEQYFLMTDYALWKVILNGDSPPSTRFVDGVETPYPSTTLEEKLARKNKLKAKGTLLMALPNEHQLKFNSYKTANTNKVVDTAHGVFAANSKTNASNLPNVDSLTVDGNVDYESQNIPIENRKESRPSKHQDNMSREAPKSTMPIEETTSNDLVFQCLESVDAGLEVYKKNEAVFTDDIKILKLDVMFRDKAITELK